MSTVRLKFKLAKVLIAAAWADGRLANEELNELKDFLFGIPEIGTADWKKLMVYMESPVAEEESRQLVDDLLLEVRNRREQRMVLETLGRLAAADGDVCAEEEAFIASVEEAMATSKRGILGRLRRGFRRVLRGRPEEAGATSREAQIGDYINNEVYHYLAHAKRQSGAIRLPDEDVRRICLAAGLTAWVLHSDLVIDREDLRELEHSLCTDWGVTPGEATVVAEAACEKIARGVDFNRLCRTYYEVSSPEQALALTESLERMAARASKGRPEKAAAAARVRRSLKLAGD